MVTKNQYSTRKRQRETERERDAASSSQSRASFRHSERLTLRRDLWLRPSGAWGGIWSCWSHSSWLCTCSEGGGGERMGISKLTLNFRGKGEGAGREGRERTALRTWSSPSILSVV